MKFHQVLVLLALLTNVAYGSSIGLFGDPGFTSCNLDIPAPPGTGMLYIVAIDCAEIPNACPAFTGAEFRVVGLPAGWVTISTPSPETLVALGDPFGSGASISFPGYQTSNSLLLYTVTLWPAMAGAQATLQVTAHSAASHPSYICPVAYVGDCPGPIRSCVDGGTLLVNSQEHCTVAVTQATWSGVKRLYH